MPTTSSSDRRRAEMEMHLVLLVDRLYEPADLGSHDALHRDRLGCDDVHLQLPRAQGGVIPADD